MNKKLMAVAVAGAFAVPTLAVAQVTVSGKLGIQLTNVKISDFTAARTLAATPNSSTFVNDNASIIRIGAREDLGGGMEAFGQYEIRPNLDGSTGTGTAGASNAGALPVGSATGVSFVGLRSSAYGTVRAGTMPTWGDGNGSGLSPETSQHYSTSGMTNYIMIAGAPLAFSSSRQPNVIMYSMPAMGGLNVSAGWASNPLGVDDDLLRTATRKGQAWYFMPNYTLAGIGKFGWAYADIKTETSATAIYDMKANKLFWEGRLAGVEVGLSYAKITAKAGNAATAAAAGILALTPGATAGTKIADVTKWWIPVRYKVGKNTFGFMYIKSGDDKAQLGDQGSKQTSLAYNYSFSNRTNAGISWVKVKNAAASGYDITSMTGNGYGAGGASLGSGEDMNLIAVSLNHTF